MSRPPRTCFIRSNPAEVNRINKRSSPVDVKKNKRSRVCHRKILNSSNYSSEMMPISVYHPGAADIKIQPKSPEFLLDMRYFCNFSLFLARHPSAFTSMRGTDTAGRGALESPPEAGARTMLFDRLFQFRESHTWVETKTVPDRIPEIKKMILYIYTYIFSKDVSRKFDVCRVNTCLCKLRC